MAKKLGDTGLSAAILNNLGNFFTAQKKDSEALGAYLESMTLAQRSGNALLATRARTHAAMAAMRHGRFQDSRALLDRALDETRGFEPSHDKAYGLVNIGSLTIISAPVFPGRMISLFNPLRSTWRPSGSQKR